MIVHKMFGKSLTYGRNLLLTNSLSLVNPCISGIFGRFLWVFVFLNFVGRGKLCFLVGDFHFYRN